MADNLLTGESFYSQDVPAKLKTLDTLVSDIDKSMQHMLTTVVKLSKELGVLKISQGSDEDRKKIAALSQELDSLRAAVDKLKQTKAQAQKQTETEKEAARQATAQAKLEAKAALAATDSYNKLSAQLALALAKHKMLTKAERENTQAGRDLTAQIKQMRDELKRLDAQTGTHVRNVGNYKSGNVGLIGTLRTLTATYLSLSGAQALVNKVFGDTKALDGISKAYLQVLGSQDKVAESQDFLKDITERYGLSLIDTSRSYLRFRVATDAANFSASKTNEIFDSVAKSASFIGLSADDTAGVFRALEQIMSKGTVQAEELRGQLGDRLPGAFIIMAKALGVTTQELNKMLKDGKVLSSEALPKFAKELEKTFNLENIDRVDNLASAQGRFNREITLAVEKLDAAGYFKAFFDTLAGGVKFIGDNISAISTLASIVLRLVAVYAVWKAAQLVQLGLMRFVAAETVKEITLKNLQAAATLRLGAAVNTLNKFIRANPIGLFVTAVTALVGVVSLLRNKLDGLERAETEIAAAQKQVSTEVAGTKTKVDALIKAYGGEKTSLGEKKKILGEIEKIMPGVLNNLDKNKLKVEDLKKATDDYIFSLKNRLKLEAAETGLKNVLSEIDAIDEKLTDADFLNNPLRNTGGVIVDYLFGTGLSANGLADKRRELTKTAKEIEKEISSILQTQLNGNATTETTTTDTPKGDDKGLLTEIERLKELNAQRADGYDKDIEELRIYLLEKTALFKKNGIDTQILEEYNQRKLAEIKAKYIQQTLDADEKANQEFLKKQEELTELLTKTFVTGPASSIKLGKEERDAKIKALEDEFAATQDFQKQKFDLEKHTELEIKEFAVQQEIDFYEFRLKLAESAGLQLTDIEKQRYSELIDLLKTYKGNLKNGDKKEETDLFSLLGIDIDDDQKKLVDEAFQYAKDQLNNYFELQAKLKQQAVDNANERIAAAQKELDYQRTLEAEGYANKVQSAEKELLLARKQQKQAIKDQQAFQRAQLAVNTALEASSLTVAIAKIAKDVPFPFNIAAIGVMLGTFAAAKIKAFQLVNKATFGKGGTEKIKGGKHNTGNDTYLGFESKGKPAFGEAGELHAVVTAKATKRYEPEIRDIIDAANSGRLHQHLTGYQNPIATQIPVFNNEVNVDMSTTEGYLKRIASKKSVTEYTNSLGERVVVDPFGNKTTYKRYGQ